MDNFAPHILKKQTIVFFSKQEKKYELKTMHFFFISYVFVFCLTDLVSKIVDKTLQFHEINLLVNFTRPLLTVRFRIWSDQD